MTKATYYQYQNLRKGFYNFVRVFLEQVYSFIGDIEIYGKENLEKAKKN